MDAYLVVGTLLFLGVGSSFGEEKVVFSESYSPQDIPPKPSGEPLLVEASINLRNILEVKEKEQIISLETTLRLYWKVLDLLQ